MSFPQTRLTLVHRLAAGGSEQDWQAFLQDYWGPLCRFAHGWGAGSLSDAEDVASQTIEALWQNQLLTRWAAHRSAKLRTLLCTVARNILANRGRVRSGRERLVSEVVAQLEARDADRGESIDVFYAAWVEDLLARTVSALASEYAQAGKADYVRVLYGRICEGLSIAAVAQALGLSAANVDNYYRHSRARLSERLSEELRRQLERYADNDEREEEFRLEWGQLGDHLARRGGLEKALAQAYATLDLAAAEQQRRRGLSQARLGAARGVAGP